MKNTHFISPDDQRVDLFTFPSDPLLSLQWYLGPDRGVNVFPIWQQYSGSGVKVAVFDQGIDPNHPDLNDNLIMGLGRNASNLSTGGSPVTSTDNHGTVVAGVIAAESNGQGIVGVAYDASLVSIYSPLKIYGFQSQIVNAYNYAVNFDVLNSSWGFANGFASGATWAFYDNFLTSFNAAGKALENLATNGRNGLGTVVVQSAGNAYGYGDDTNLHSFQNSQYIITVAATDYFGNAARYSSPGASILIAAPGGGATGTSTDIVTTDRLGWQGYSYDDYTFAAGTSFSAPIVSGIVALMLEANPNLGYRDIQEILAYSAKQVSSEQNTWEYNSAKNWNGGGLHYDSLIHDLGFGLVDATAAVRLAQTWSTVPQTADNRQQISATHFVNKVIPDKYYASSPALDLIYVDRSIDVERVEVTLNVTHSYIGDLSVLLLSPSGTTSFLLWRPQQSALSAYGSSQNDINFTFNTVLNWGENSQGYWSLAIFDNAAGDVGTFDSWSLNVIGKTNTDDDTYIYTDEYATAYYDSPERSFLTDLSGTDTINCAACTTSVLLNLNANSTSMIAGKPLVISSGVLIENAYGGDSDDLITGNAAQNKINGMRGNDTLVGGLGNDLLDGGEGNDIATFTGMDKNYTLLVSRSSSEVVDRTINRDGTDMLTNIESIQFSNSTLQTSWFTDAGNLASNPASADAFDTLTSMYLAYFNRAPDATGLYYWASNVYQGQTFNQIAENFFNAPETQALYPNPIDTQSSVADMTVFINSVYQNVLNRTPDSGGFDYWLNGLQTGSSTATGFILQIIKAAVAPTGGPLDAAYFTAKNEVGSHFSITNGLTDGTQAKAVIDLFNGTYGNNPANLSIAQTTANSLADSYLANVGSSQQLVVQLVGYDMA
jgi:subtilisin family serine protease